MKLLGHCLIQAGFIWASIVLGAAARSPAPASVKWTEVLILGTFTSLVALGLLVLPWLIIGVFTPRKFWGWRAGATWLASISLVLVHEAEEITSARARLMHWKAELSEDMACSQVLECKIRSYSLIEPTLELVVIRACDDDLEMLRRNFLSGDHEEIAFRYKSRSWFDYAIPESVPIRLYRRPGTERGLFAVIGGGPTVLYADTW